ncbi:S8 family serine peptidase [Streptomyces sp. NBC_01481]|uniref:S8 family serine peptidase n=1 Tax=Streptomyces sp. NBC_01481 TaxID=2975869 RepID=UPI002259D79F|nr:S8 family serine peptidase [Streptomyces sp. NBC_01481]MCX4587713.1 S8 family serine peptidase [Streptomyces sp. NBC_01481]
MSDMGGTSVMADAGVAKIPGGEYTGRYLVLLDSENLTSGVAALEKQAGISKPEHVSGAEAASASQALAEGQSIVLDDLGVAIVSVDLDQRPALAGAVTANSAILHVEQERVLYACTAADEYLRGYDRGYRAGRGDCPDNRVAEGVRTKHVDVDWGESEATWGIQAVLAHRTELTGSGVGVAVLDTGFAPSHQDFDTRIADRVTFVPGETADDGNGHGTHCAGTACGPKHSPGRPRYGVACEANLYIGKVLNDQGRGEEGQILTGLNWAITQSQVKVVSMSFSAAVAQGQPPSWLFERAAQVAARRGKLLVAAAGNDSSRPHHSAPVGHPANCPSVLSVAGIGPDRRVAPFSCAGLNSGGGEVNLAAPGVDVFSSSPSGHRRLSGTSMAAPHVAGVAALLWQKHPHATPADIKNYLITGASHLHDEVVDVGAGLVQAP